MDANRRVVLVVPALDEEASIGEVVRAFRARTALAEVVVVDNGSRDRTAARAREAGAVVVHVERRGYGAALGAGIEHALRGGATAVVLAEADGTFDPAELGSLLAGLAESDLVLGSRSAGLGTALRLGNGLVARLLALLWWPRSIALSDVGCTYRALRAQAWRALEPARAPAGPEFSPWMIGAAFRARLRVREIPVRYGPRTGGASKHGGSAGAVVRTALRMLRAVLGQRLGLL